MNKKDWIQIRPLYDEDGDYVASVEIDWLHDKITFRFNRVEEMKNFMEDFEVNDM